LPRNRREGGIRHAHRGIAATAGTPACGAGSRWGTWRSGEGASGRGLERWEGRRVTRGRGEQEVADSDQGRRITPAAEEPGRQSRGEKQRRQEEERGKNWIRDWSVKSEKGRDLTAKDLQLFNQCSNEDGPKSKVHGFSNSTTSL
jgi:hypothetical protein